MFKLLYHNLERNVKTMPIRKKRLITLIFDAIIYYIVNLGQAPPTYKEVNNIPYIVKELKKSDITIELRAKIPDKMLKYPYEDLKQEEKNNIYNKLYGNLTFSSSEILILFILLSNYLEDNYDISLNQIHKAFRGMSIKQPIEVKARKMYKNTIYSLSKKIIFIKTSKNFRKIKSPLNNLNIVNNLITIFNQEDVKNGDVKYTYTFNRLGDILKNSKHLSNDIIPSEIFHIGITQIPKFLIGTYLGMLIFTNRRKNCNYFIIKLTTIMRIIPYFNKKQQNTNKSYLVKLEEVFNRTTLLRRFLNYILDVLNLLKSQNKIKDFSIIPANVNKDNASIKTYEEIKFKVFLKYG